MEHSSKPSVGNWDSCSTKVISIEDEICSEVMMPVLLKGRLGRQVHTLQGQLSSAEVQSSDLKAD